MRENVVYLCRGRRPRRPASCVCHCCNTENLPIEVKFSDGPSKAPAPTVSNMTDPLSSGTLWTTAVKSRIFAQSGPCGKKHGGRKSGKKGIWGRRDLCKSVLHIHKLLLLWKTPVEKAVENVENSQFSTGIWLPRLRTAPCGKLCIPVCIKQITKRLQKRYVTVHQP